MSDSFNQAAHRHAMKVAALVIDKQKDYGKGNILNSVVDPRLLIAIRLQDKIARLAHLTQSGKTPKLETLQDTADDIIGYGIVLGMVIDGTFSLPVEEL